MTASTLTDFLLARIAEDSIEAGAMLGDTTPPSAYDAAQVWQHPAGDPERVLVECQAKRRIVSLHAGVRDAETTPTCEGCGEPILGAVTPPACETVRALALPYADHPDYRDEWKP